MKLFKIFLWILSMFITVNLFSQQVVTISVDASPTSDLYTDTVVRCVGQSIKFVNNSPYSNFDIKINNTLISPSIGVSNGGDIFSYTITDFDTVYKVKVIPYGDPFGYKSAKVEIQYLGGETINNSKLLVFPNPTTEILNITGVEVNDVKVYDMNGRVVMSQSFNSETTVVLDVLYLDNGIYFAVVNNKETMKFIKK